MKSWIRKRKTLKLAKQCLYLLINDKLGKENNTQLKLSRRMAYEQHILQRTMWIAYATAV